MSDVAWVGCTEGDAVLPKLGIGQRRYLGVLNAPAGCLSGLSEGLAP
jgi:hypothetical protein